MDRTRTAVALSLLPGRLRFEVVSRLTEARPSNVDLARPLGALLTDAWPEHGPELVPLVRRLEGEAQRHLDRAARRGLRAVSFTDPAYPPLLLHVRDAPAVLWVRGHAAVLGQPVVAVVGSRSATPAGLEAARAMAADLAEAGVVVVSGLARGVDGAAHEGALATGRTVAVLGCGADVTYPPEHDGLARRIASSGAVVAEFPPGTPPQRHHFPLRNRLISGLASAVVVVEAGHQSGALITARLALDQGREVMAMPGHVTGGRNRGAHALIKDGALLVESGRDVLDALRFLPTGSESQPPSGQALMAPDDPVLRALLPGVPVEVDRVVASSGRPAPEVLARIAALELDGWLERASGGRVVRVARKW